MDFIVSPTSHQSGYPPAFQGRGSVPVMVCLVPGVPLSTRPERVRICDKCLVDAFPWRTFAKFTPPDSSSSLSNSVHSTSTSSSHSEAAGERQRSQRRKSVGRDSSSPPSPGRSKRSDSHGGGADQTGPHQSYFQPHGIPSDDNHSPSGTAPPTSPLSPNIYNHPFFVGGYGSNEAYKGYGGGDTEGETCANCNMSLPKGVSEQLPHGAPGSPTKDGKGRNGSPILRSREAFLAPSIPTDWSDHIPPSDGPPRPLSRGEDDTTTTTSNHFDLNDASRTSTPPPTPPQPHTHTLTYLTTRHPPSQKAYSLLRRSCIRTLSCENLPRGTPAGPLAFGDPIAGYTIAFIFRLPDPRARGRRRSYALLALGGRDGRRVFRASTEITKAFASIAAQIVAMAEQAVEKENTKRDGSHSRATTSGAGRDITPVSSFLSGRTVDPDGYPRRAGEVRAKGLAELVGKEDFFVDLHVQFVQLLARLGREFGGFPTAGEVLDAGIRGEVGEYVGAGSRRLQKEIPAEGKAHDGHEHDHDHGHAHSTPHSPGPQFAISPSPSGTPSSTSTPTLKPSLSTPAAAPTVAAKIDAVSRQQVVA
ncbi:MAG: hypothetical protein M1819_003036 [Sarea resinae]|nr:MAG: hypothetical protein M1819_003036 [Sarea resinae]